MKVLVIMHVASEGPGTLGVFLKSNQVNIQTARLYAGAKLPDEVTDFNAIVSMGGPINVYEEDRYPFLREEVAFLQRAIMADIPILGICLGAQMIARACKAPVKKSPVKEVGWYDVSLTEPGQQDPLFKELPQSLRVFQWHEDTFELPIQGTLLATATECPHQAFRCCKAYGLQFHVEVTRDMLVEWFDDSEEQQEIVHHFEAVKYELSQQAERIYTNFLALMVNTGVHSNM